mgnify:FL=1|tara:strand:+ start:166 stop:507 length:342 start_codon:yes stop_codon:yes gene_type:complete
MKNLVLLLSFLILTQSCVSYDTVSYQNLPYQGLKIIKVKKVDETSIKGQLISADETAVVLENNGLIQTILKNEISSVKVRSFSEQKASIILAAIAYGIVIGVILILPPFPALG